GLVALQSDDIAGCVHLYGAPGGGGGGGGTGPGPDQQAPSIPTNLVATAVSTSQINLMWSASTDNVGVANYNIFVGATLVGTVASTTASVTGLTTGTSYTFKVAACDAAGNCSSQSNGATASTMTADSQAPSVPTNLVANTINTTQIALSWSASTDNVGVSIYRIYANSALLGQTSGTSTTATAQNLTPGTTYSFNVTACDAAGNCSAQSSTAMATTVAGASCAGSQPANDTQTLACPVGQVGLITQSRSYSCVGTTWTPSAFQTTSNTCVAATTGPTTSYQDMWWAGSSENGWGLTITQHSNTLFLAWYVYDAQGNPFWIVMPGGNWNTAHTT
ncbi:MAG TPA: fibronectin type III domain-containing protein, partial [Usitatibacter sp.]